MMCLLISTKSLQCLYIPTQSLMCPRPTSCYTMLECPWLAITANSTTSSPQQLSSVV